VVAIAQPHLVVATRHAHARVRRPLPEFATIFMKTVQCHLRPRRLVGRLRGKELWPFFIARRGAAGDSKIGGGVHRPVVFASNEDGAPELVWTGSEPTKAVEFHRG
jgi:hypothetical protein